MSRFGDDCACEGEGHTRACRVGKEHARAVRAAEIAAWNDAHPAGSWVDVHPGPHSWRRVQTLGPAVVVVGVASVPVAKSLSRSGYLPMASVYDPTPTRSHGDYATALTGRDVTVWEELVAAHAAAASAARLLLASHSRLAHPRQYGPQAVYVDGPAPADVMRRLTDAVCAADAAQDDAALFAETVCRDLLRPDADGVEARAWRAVSALTPVVTPWASDVEQVAGLAGLASVELTLAAARDLLHVDDTRVRVSWRGFEAVDTHALADLLRPAMATDLIGRCRCELGGGGTFFYEAQAGGAEASFRADLARLVGRSPSSVFGWDDRLGSPHSLPSWEDGAP